MDSIDGDDKGVRKKADRLEEMPVGPRGLRVERWLLGVPSTAVWSSTHTKSLARSPVPEKAGWEVVEDRGLSESSLWFAVFHGINPSFFWDR
jgi:hypothetical protein